MPVKYRVHLSKADCEAAVFDSASDIAVLDSARLDGIHMANYCRQGGCGACTAKLISGSVEYIRKVKGAPQQPVEGDLVRPCSMCPRSDLELEPLSSWKVLQD